MPDEPPRLTDAPGDYGPSGRSPWMDVDWREHQRWVTIDGRQVNLIELGSGSPVVFIHGLSGSWQNWLEQVPVFARDHRVIAFDLPGFGASEMPREKITISGYGRFVAALLDKLGVEQRRGGQLDGRLHRVSSIRFPERVRRLVW
jgi:pimeloyl-ACP methyl ester carboxylesterase